MDPSKHFPTLFLFDPFYFVVLFILLLFLLLLIIIIIIIIIINITIIIFRDHDSSMIFSHSDAKGKKKTVPSLNSFALSMSIIV